MSEKPPASTASSETFTCASCGQTFETAWSDEEAAQELAETFPSFAKEDCSVICDDCWQAHGMTDPLANMAAYQGAVAKWMVETFGEVIAMDPLERTMRFLEEAMELAQAEGMTRDECVKVLDYVYSRPTGETFQEVGGVMVTLAAFCFRRGVSLQQAALTEFHRVDSPEMRKKIFDKQAFKHAQGLTSDGGFRKPSTEEKDHAND